MKKFMALLLAIFTISFTTYTIASEERGYINANASINKEISPDTVEFSVSIINYDNQSIQNATKKNKEISDNIYNALKSMINSTNGDYVKTSDYSVQPLYNYTNNKRVFDKYEVSNRITVHTKSVENVGKMIDKAILLGATNIDSLNFTISSYDDVCDDLLYKAAQKTKIRAANYAKATETSIVGVKNISGSCSSSNTNNQIRYNMMAKGSTLDATSSINSTPIEKGIIKIYANVDASYFVK